MVDMVTLREFKFCAYHHAHTYTPLLLQTHAQTARCSFCFLQGAYLFLLRVDINCCKPKRIAMAEAPDPSDKRLEELEEEITCAVCHGHYQEAKLLPCMHYYCRACIEGLAKRSRGRPFPCPECRKDTTLPSGGAEQLQGAFSTPSFCCFGHCHPYTCSVMGKGGSIDICVYKHSYELVRGVCSVFSGLCQEHISQD